jgi:hypothetical protein
MCGCELGPARIFHRVVAFTTRPWPDDKAVGKHEPPGQFLLFGGWGWDNIGGLQHVRLQLAQC